MHFKAQKNVFNNRVSLSSWCYEARFDCTNLHNCRLFQVGGRIILEGVLKVYWGLKVPVTLASHNLSYWRRRSQKEQNGLMRSLAVKNKDSVVSKFFINC